MVSRSIVLAAAAAMCWAGGCQTTAPVVSSGTVPVAPQVARADGPADPNAVIITDPVEPMVPIPQHAQTPEELAAKIRAYTAANPPVRAYADAENSPTAETVLPAPRPEPAAVRPAGRAAERTAERTARVIADATPPARPAVYSEKPDPAKTARAATLESASGARVLNSQPDLVPEESDFAQTAGAEIGPNDPNLPLEDRLRRRAHESPHDTLAQLDWELYCTLKEDSQGGFTSVAMLPDRERELVSSLIDGIRNFRSTLASDRDPMFEKELGPLLAMADRVRSQAELQVPVIALCRKVQAFGNYELMDADHLPAGRDTKVIVYCEVENFVPQLDSHRMWETRLKQHTALYSDTGTEMWADQARDVSDVCRNRRRDFFLTNVVTLPASLPAGRYTMKVTVEDSNANKFNENAMQLTIVGAPAPVKPAVPVEPSHIVNTPLWPGQQPGSAGLQYEPSVVPGR